MFFDPVNIPVQVPSSEGMFSEPADKDYSVIPEPTPQAQRVDPYMVAAAQENGMNVPGANVNNMSMEDLLKYGQFYSDLHGNKYNSGVLGDTLDVIGSTAGGAASILGGLVSGYQGLTGDHAAAAETSAGVSDFVSNVLHTDSYAARQRALAAQMALKQEENKKQYQRDLANGKGQVTATLGLIGRGVMDELTTKSGFDHLNTVAAATGSLAPAALVAATSVPGAVVAGTAAVTAAEAGSIYGQAAAEAAQAINNMSTAELYERSPEFGNHVSRYLEAGYPQNIAESRARVDIFEEAASQAGNWSIPAALTTFVPYAGKIAKNVLPKATDAVVKTSAGKELGGLAVGALAEGVEEAAQESAGTVISNAAVQHNIDKDKAYFESVGEAMASGFIGGVGSRLSLDTAPAVGHALQEIQQSAQEAKPEDTPPAPSGSPESPKAPEPVKGINPETSEPGEYSSAADHVNDADTAGPPKPDLNESTPPDSDASNEPDSDSLGSTITKGLLKKEDITGLDLSMLKEGVENGTLTSSSESDDRVIRAIKDYSDFSKQFEAGIQEVATDSISGNAARDSLTATRNSINSMYAEFINGIRDQRPSEVSSSISGMLRLAQIRANKAEALLKSHSNNGEKVKYRTYQARSPYKEYAAEISSRSSNLATAIPLEFGVALTALSKVLNNPDVSGMDIDFAGYRKKFEELSAIEQEIKGSKKYTDMLNDLSEQEEARKASIPPDATAPEPYSGSFIPEVSEPAVTAPAVTAQQTPPAELPQQQSQPQPQQQQQSPSIPEEPAAKAPEKGPEVQAQPKTESVQETAPAPQTQSQPEETAQTLPEVSETKNEAPAQEPVIPEPVQQKTQPQTPEVKEDKDTEPAQEEQTDVTAPAQNQEPEESQPQEEPETQVSEPEPEPVQSERAPVKVEEEENEEKNDSSGSQPKADTEPEEPETLESEPVQQQEDTTVSEEPEPAEAPESVAQEPENRTIPEPQERAPEPAQRVFEPAPVNPDTDVDPDIAATAPDEESDAAIMHTTEGEVHEEPEEEETAEEAKEAKEEKKERKYRFHWEDATNTAVEENASKELLLDKSLTGEDFEKSAARLNKILTENFGEGVRSVQIYASDTDSYSDEKISRLADTSGMTRLLKRAKLNPDPGSRPFVETYTDPAKADEETFKKIKDLIYNLGISGRDDIDQINSLNNDILKELKGDLGKSYPVVDSPVILLDESKPLNEIYQRAKRFGRIKNNDLRAFMLKEYLKGRGYHILNAAKISKINSDNPESLIQLLDYVPRNHELAGVNFTNQASIKPKVILKYLKKIRSFFFIPDIHGPDGLTLRDYVEFKGDGLASVNMEYSLPETYKDPVEKLNAMALINRAMLFNVVKDRYEHNPAKVYENAKAESTKGIIRDTANALKEFANHHMANSKFTNLYKEESLKDSKAMSRYQQTGSAIYFDYGYDENHRIRASLNHEMADAASMAVLNMLQSAAALRHVSSKATYADLASAYQVSRTDIRELSEDDIEILKTGISFEAFSKKFADTFLDVLGVASDRNISESADGERTARALGMVVGHFLQNKGWAEIKQVTLSETKKVNIIRILKPESDEDTEITIPPEYKFDIKDKNLIPRTLALASFKNRIDYYADDIMPDINLVRKSGGLPMSQEEKATVLKDRQVKYYFNPVVFNIFNTLNTEGILKYKGIKYISSNKHIAAEIAKTMNENSFLSEKGKTDGIARALTINRERAKKILEQDPERRYIRFDSYLGVNDRLVQRGDGSTPLSTKMDRALLNNVQEELDPRNPEHMRQFFKAVFQILGGKVHKNTDEQIKKSVKKVAKLIQESKLISIVPNNIGERTSRDALINSLDFLEAEVKKIGLGYGNFELRMLAYSSLMNYNRAMRAKTGTKFINNVYIEYDGSSDGTHNAQIVSSPKTGGSLATMSRTGLEFGTQESKREKFSRPGVLDAYESSLEKSKEIANERIRGDETGNAARFVVAFSELTRDKYLKIDRVNSQLEKFERDAGKIQATAINYGQGEESNREFTQDLLLQGEFDSLCNALLTTLPREYKKEDTPFRVAEFIRSSGDTETVDLFNRWDAFFTAMETMAGREEVSGEGNGSIFRNNVTVSSQEELDNVRNFIRYASMYQMTAHHMNLSNFDNEESSSNIVYAPSEYSDKVPGSFMREYQIHSIWGKTFDYLISDPVYQGNRENLGNGYISFINKVTAISQSIDLLAREREINAYALAGTRNGTLPSRKAMDRFREQEKFNRNINSNLHSSTGTTVSNSKQRQLTDGEHTLQKDFKIEMPAKLDRYGNVESMKAGASITTRRSAIYPGLTLISPNTTIAYGDAFMQNDFASSVAEILEDPTEAGIDDDTANTLEQAANRYDGVESPTLGSEKIGEMLCASDLRKMKLNPYNALAFNFDALLYNEETASYLAKQFNSNPSFAYALTEAINGYYINDTEFGGGQFSISSGEEAVSYLKQMSVDFSGEVSTISRQNLAVAETMEFTSTHVAIDDVKYVHKPDHPKIVEMNSIYNLVLESMGDADEETMYKFHAKEIERRAYLVDAEGNLDKEGVDSYIQELRETHAELLQENPVPESEWPPEPEPEPEAEGESSSGSPAREGARRRKPTLKEIVEQIPAEYSPEIFEEDGFLKNIDRSVANFIRNGLFDNVKIEVMWESAINTAYGGQDGFLKNSRGVVGFFANNSRKIVINRTRLKGKNKTQIAEILAHELVHAAGNSIVRLGTDTDIKREDIARMAESLNIPVEEMDKRIASYRNGAEVLKDTALAVNKFLGPDTADNEGNVSNAVIEKYVSEYSGRIPAQKMRSHLYYLHRNIRALKKAVDNKENIFLPLAEIMALSVQAGVTSDFMDEIKLNRNDHTRVFQGLTRFLHTLYRAAADLITRVITGVVRGVDTISARDVIRDVVNVLADKRMQESMVYDTSVLYKKGEQYSRFEETSKVRDMLNNSLVNEVKSSSRLFSEPEELEKFDEVFTAYISNNKGGALLGEVQNILTGIYESLANTDMLTAAERESLSEQERQVLTGHRQDILDLSGEYRYPVLLALSASSNKFREIIDAIPEDKLSRRIKDISVVQSGKKDIDNVLNNFAERKTAELLNKLTSKKLKGAPASIQLDALRGQIREAALRKEKADIVSRALNATDDASKKMLAKAGQYVAKKSQLAAAVGTVLGENTLARDAFLKWSNKPQMPGVLKGLFNFSVRELFAADDNYSQIQKMEKKARADIQSVRASFREIVPQKIEEELMSYGYELTPERSEALTRTVLALDLGCLTDGQITDAVNRNQRYLGNLGYTPIAGVNNKKLQVFADDLAHKLATGMYKKSGGTHYRSAEGLLRGLAGYGKYTKEVANKLNEEITLKALSLVPESQFNLLKELTENPKAFKYVISQQRSMVSSDLENAEFKFNTIKGYYPKTQTNTVNVITVHNPESVELYKSMGYKVTGTVKSDFTNKTYVYLASPYNPVSSFTQGALQTAVNRSGGISNYTGISSEPILETFTGKDNLIKLGKRDMESMQDHVPVYSRTGWLVGYEVLPDMNKFSGKEYEPDFAKNVGFWAGRIFEQSRVDNFNKDIVYALKRQWDKATKEEKKNYIDLSKSNDRVVRDAMNSLSPKVRADIKELFPDGFMVRKDMIEDVIGYRNASVVDLLTGNISWLSAQNADKLGATLRNMFGNKLISFAVKTERLFKSTSSTVRNIIVIRSGQVMAMNALGNLLQLTALGVPLKEIYKNVPDMVRQLEHWQVYRKRQIALSSKINGLSHSSEQNERLRLGREYSAIEAGTRKAVPDVIDLIDSGELSTIADLGEVNDDLLPSMGKWGERLEEMYSKLPEVVQTTGRYTVVSKGTALYRFLEKGTQYGDFIAKAVYYKHLVEVKGMPKEKAQNLVRYMFVNYDMLAGRSRAYLENIGLLWFYNYKLRATRTAMYMIRHNPLKALLSLTVPGVEDIGTALSDNLLSKIISGGWWNSIGPGTLLSGPSQNLWSNIFL